MFPRQAATRATGALNNAKQTRVAVGKTLRDIEGLLANTSEWSLCVSEWLLLQSYNQLLPTLLEVFRLTMVTVAQQWSFQK